ncbi:MAG: DUF4345 family protein [Pseudomonadota bacterium]
MDIIANGLNIFLALGTIGLGLFGLLRPVQTMEYIGTAPTDDTGLAKSEVRAASGGVWVGGAVGALLIGSPAAYAVLGALWAGAAIGRGMSVTFDKANSGKPVIFFAVEVVFAALLLAINLPALF